MEQGTPEWFEARAGKITASAFADVMSFNAKGKPLKCRTDYIGQIVAEVLSGQPAPQARAPALSWGNDVEAAARAAYEAETGHLVERVGFVIHPLLAYVGCSPDGLIGGDGTVQIKCPYNSQVHIETILKGMPEDHIPQVQGELWVTGRQWSDFVSYDPRLPPHLRLYVQRVERDDAFIETLAAHCRSAWDEVQAGITQLNQRKAA